MKRQLLTSIPLAAVLVAASCGGDDGTGDSQPTPSGADAELSAEVVEHYADGVYASYAASVDSATAMSEDIDAFLADPTEETLAAARQAWLDARPDYGVTEAFRFYGGPIDAEETGPEGQINAWPMDESYVDYVEGDPDAGIIGNPEEYPSLDAESLAELNEAGGETNVSTGWHAIEFLLWGQDLAEDGPGERPASDFATTGDDAAEHGDRRGEYLGSVTELLLSDLQGLADAWDPEADDNYRAQFLAKDSDEALTDIITGIGELSRGELAGERMSIAYTERSEEDEHSCFSDNTTEDIVANAQGIVNVVTGEYPGGVSGPGVADLFASNDEAASGELVDAVNAGLAAAEAIPAPFDQHLQDGVSDDGEGRVAIKTTMDNLGAQTDLIVNQAAELGLSVEVS
ncbi:MAG: imelysin family protein [Microthrixaceae bacterium]